MSDFEIKIYELNYLRNEHAHELRWKFMYAYVAGSLAFWGFIVSASKGYLIPRAILFLPFVFAIFGFWAYYALRQNMRVRGQVMQGLEDKFGVIGWQTLRRSRPKRELLKPLVAFGYSFWLSMIVVSLIFAILVRT